MCVACGGADLALNLAAASWYSAVAVPPRCTAAASAAASVAAAAAASASRAARRSSARCAQGAKQARRDAAAASQARANTTVAVPVPAEASEEWLLSQLLEDKLMEADLRRLHKRFAIGGVSRAAPRRIATAPRSLPR